MYEHAFIVLNVCSICQVVCFTFLELSLPQGVTFLKPSRFRERTALVCHAKDKKETSMSSSPHQPPASPAESTRSIWLGRLIVGLALLVWMTIGAVLLWVIGRMIGSVVLLAIAALLAYAIFPFVKVLQRIMPRFLAILIVYLVVLVGLSILLYFVVLSAIEQFSLLVQSIQFYLRPEGQRQLQPLLERLSKLGISTGQLRLSEQQLLAQFQGIISNVAPLASSVFTVFIDVLVVATLNIYFLLDGARVTQWLRHRTPLTYRKRITFLVDTVQHTVGGYIRGELALAVLISTLTGLGVGLLGVPYAVLLGLLAFIFAFIPIIGGYLVGATCILFALTKGWTTALLVSIFVIILHGGIQGQILGPRIVGKSVGLHPIVALFALVAGAELFGLLGALFAAPIAGVLQTVLLAFWLTWRKDHPEEFPQEDTVS